MKIEQAKALKLEAQINRNEEVRRAGKGPRGPWLVALAALLALATVLWWTLRGAPETPRPTSTDETQPAETASTPSPVAESSSGAFTAAGYVEPVPPYPVKITPLVAGRIDRFTIREGEPVKAGDVVAEMNAVQHEKQAAELAATAAVTAERLEFAERELARTQSLAERGASPVRDLDKAASDVSVLRAETERIAAELETVRWRIEQSKVRSPVDGILYERAASEGHFINLDERHEIASIIDPRQMQVWVDINQRDVAKIAEGSPAAISLDAEPGRKLQAKVDRILPKASLAKNTVRVVLRLEEFSPALRPEMSVKVEFAEP
jgi:RND family efflux transporter MFP subunit